MQRISPDVYDEAYFLSATCEGADEYHAGRGLSALKRRQVALLAPGPGVRILDIGCGRGEVLLACARAGAQVAGIDYSQAAIRISRDTLSPVPDADLRAQSATQLPWPDAEFDAVLCGDVIEHLIPADGDAVLREAHRVLRPGGRLVLHTAPNRLFLRVAWPLSRRPLRAVGHAATVRRFDAWVAASRRYHPRELTLYGLRRGLRRAGFTRSRVWVGPVLREGGHHTMDNVGNSALMRLAIRVADIRPLRVLTGNDLWAVGVK